MYYHEEINSNKISSYIVFWTDCAEFPIFWGRKMKTNIFTNCLATQLLELKADSSHVAGLIALWICTMLIFSHVKLHGEMEINVCASRNDILKKKTPRMERQLRGPVFHICDLIRSTDWIAVRQCLCRYTKARVFDIKRFIVCILHQLDLQTHSCCAVLWCHKHKQMSTSWADQHVCFAQNILLHRGVGIVSLFILTLLSRRLIVMLLMCRDGRVRAQITFSFAYV